MACASRLQRSCEHDMRGQVAPAKLVTKSWQGIVCEFGHRLPTAHCDEELAGCCFQSTLSQRVGRVRW
eukprot:7792633-Alexandrium_andersonii.AAC.1